MMPTRRDVMRAMTLGAAGLSGALTRWGPSYAARPVEAAIGETLRGASARPGRVSLGIPQVAENGLSVFTTVTVESPMSEADHVKAIHLFSEKNPLPRIASFRIGPRAGRAKISTNIRLADTQKVTAIAELSDGSFWSDEKSVIVTIAACIDGG